MRTLLIVGFVAAAGAAIGCSRAQGIEPQPPRPVKAQPVTVAPRPGGIRYSASIEPFEQVSLAFKTSGYVDDLLVRAGADGRSRAAQAGDMVSRGTVLARVREADYRHRLEQGQASLAEGEATLAKARADLERALTLYAAESLTKPELDAAQANFDASVARIAAAKADIEVARNALRDCALVAPAAGVLLERRIEVGSLVTGGTVAFTLGDVSSVKARFGVPDTAVAAINPGDAIAVAVDSVGSGSFAGRVTAISPAADPKNRVFDVEVTIKNGDGRLRPGMIGTVVIGAGADAADTARQPLALPLEAIVRSGDNAKQYAVMVVERRGDDEIARTRRVNLGEVVGNGVTVIDGVSAGERVVTAGATLLHDGDRIRVMP
jgi:multidrug efflux system membrane fusion protein